MADTVQSDRVATLALQFEHPPLLLRPLDRALSPKSPPPPKPKRGRPAPLSIPPPKPFHSKHQGRSAANATEAGADGLLSPASLSSQSSPQDGLQPQPQPLFAPVSLWANDSCFRSPSPHSAPLSPVDLPDRPPALPPRPLIRIEHAPAHSVSVSGRESPLLPPRPAIPPKPKLKSKHPPSSESRGSVSGDLRKVNSSPALSPIDVDEPLGQRQAWAKAYKSPPTSPGIESSPGLPSEGRDVAHSAVGSPTIPPRPKYLPPVLANDERQPALPVLPCFVALNCKNLVPTAPSIVVGGHAVEVSFDLRRRDHARYDAFASVRCGPRGHVVECDVLVERCELHSHFRILAMCPEDTQGILSISLMVASDMAPESSTNYGQEAILTVAQYTIIHSRSAKLPRSRPGSPDPTGLESSSEQSRAHKNMRRDLESTVMQISRDLRALFR
ncbi:uncharacterized protein BJ171DRAFT_136906 [Polychytrium aggregatum]|uniref:uncharacterized protein n=1 Tax=Polychytrium aggregatum TaxID=110093 RepID=UPI0022FEF68C|nr:uncharacterized protein BJ171DRAFT_136906 [Polychytrium aggregatum]KAI9203577.1 hypothetical protein BJ171DRAFT_136906 [Polychytrium aggregatum]